MDFRRAEKRDLPKIMAMINDAKAAFKNLGIDQWQDGSPNEGVIINDIKEGTSYVIAGDNKTVLGYAVLTFDAEPAYKEIFGGRWLSNEPYATIHRVVTEKDSKNKGVASLLFNNFERICLERKVVWLRVDTHEDNIPMQKLIAKVDFIRSGIVYYNPSMKRIAFEKKLGTERK